MNASSPSFSGRAPGQVQQPVQARSGVLAAIGAWLVCAFTIELILGGPGYWAIGGVGIRKTLFALSFAWFLVMWLSGRIRLSSGELALAACVITVMLVWIVLLPATKGMQRFGLAMQDGQPLAMVLLAVMLSAFYRRHPARWQSLKRLAAGCLVFVAVANIVLWGIGQSGELGDAIAQTASLLWFTLGDLSLEPPLYLGTMPDGFFRAMWITGVLYVPALMVCIATRRPFGALLFLVALLATYTRALWLAAAVGIVIAQWLSAPRARFISPSIAIAVLVAAALGVAAVALSTAAMDDASLVGQINTRVADTFSDSSANERFEQVGPLLDAWRDAPLLGHGFGAQASLIRSDDAPFSYELTVLALLMKLGAVGLVLLVLLVAAPWSAAWLRTRSAPACTSAAPRNLRLCAGLASVLAFLLAASTNPFLINFVGMSLLGYLFIGLHHDVTAPTA